MPGFTSSLYLMKTATILNVLHIQLNGYIPAVTREIYQSPVSCGGSVHFCTSQNHTLEILSITSDKCNSCQDFLHTKTDTVPAAKQLFSFPSSFPPLSDFTSVTTGSCSQICEISAADHGRVVTADVRRLLIQSRPQPPESQPLHPAPFKGSGKETANSAVMGLTKSIPNFF